MTTVGSSTGASRTQQTTASEPALSTGEATQLWNTLVDNALKEGEPKTLAQQLGDTHTKAYREKMTADLQAFLKDNPNATEKDIREFFGKQGKKHQGYLSVLKFMEDSFTSRMMSKAKERQADRWR
jgi:hypothetical protein